MAASRLVMLPPAAFALGLALLTWAGWVALAPASDVPRVARAHQPPLASPAMPRPGNAQVPPPQPAPAAPAAPAPGSLVELLHEPDVHLRASVHRALAAQAVGGRLYARALARRCAALASLPPRPIADPNDPHVQRALARRDALASGCSQFTPEEWLGLVNITAHEVLIDPLLALQQSDLDDAALLQAVSRHPDPLLLDELGERLLTRRGLQQPQLFFDGTYFDDEARQAMAHAALRLLPCHFGLACDERHDDVWMRCLRGEGCAASRAQHAPGGAEALAARIAAALRAQDLARFLPPRD